MASIVLKKKKNFKKVMFMAPIVLDFFEKSKFPIVFGIKVKAKSIEYMTNILAIGGPILIIFLFPLYRSTGICSRG